MAKGGVAHVVGEANGFDKILVCAQATRQRPPDLCYLQGVGKACAIVVALGVDEDLRLVFQSAEGRSMQDAIAIPLEDGAIPRFVFGISSALRLTASHPEGCQMLVFDGFQPPSSVNQIRVLRHGEVSVTQCGIDCQCGGFDRAPTGEDNLLRLGSARLEMQFSVRGTWEDTYWIEQFSTSW